MKIHMVEYVLPNGRQETRIVDIDNKFLKDSEKINNLGLIFECEILRTGSISVSVANHSVCMDYWVELGAGSEDSIFTSTTERLITNVMIKINSGDYEKWLKENS